MSALPKAESRRYLIVSDDATVPYAERVLGKVYQVLTLEQAKNNEQLFNAHVLCWPSPIIAQTQRMRDFAIGLVDDAQEVKLVDTSAEAMSFMTLQHIATTDPVWDVKTLADYLNGRIDDVNRIQLLTAEISYTSPTDSGEPSPAMPSESQAPVPPPDMQTSPALPDDSEAFGEIPLDAYASEPIHDQIEPNWHADADRILATENQPPEPLDLTKALYRGKPLPLNLLPAVFAEFVGDCEHRTGIDRTAFFIGALGAVSGLCSNSVRLQPKQLDHKFKVHATINPFAVGNSSSGKTPGIAEAMHPVKAIDREQGAENTRKRLDYEFEIDKYEDAKRAARKAGGTRPPEPPKPSMRHVWVDKATPEGVENVLTMSPKVLWFMDEVSGLINGIDRYSSGGKGTGGREFVLGLYNGDLGKKTLSAGSSDVSRDAVICGGITPTAMREMVGKLENDGLLQRTFIGMVRTMKTGVDAKPDDAVYERFERTLRILLKSHGEKVLRLSPEAAEIYNAFDRTVMLLIHHEENESIASHLGKWRGMCARLILIFFLADLASDGKEPINGEQIPEKYAKQACGLFLDWQLSHVLEFWNEVMGAKVSRGFAQILAKFLLANPDIEEFSFRDHVAKLHWRQLEKLKPWELKEAINTLVNAAWITPKGFKLNASGVPATYEVNPRIKDMFAEERAREIESREIKRNELQKMRGNHEEREPGQD